MNRWGLGILWLWAGTLAVGCGQKATAPSTNDPLAGGGPATTSPAAPTAGVDSATEGAATDSVDSAGEQPTRSSAPTVELILGEDASADVFCEVQALLLDRCGACHGAADQVGPVLLTGYEDLLAPALDGERPVYQAVMERVRDSERPMPPVPYDVLSQQELAVLDAWVDAGVPEPKSSCSSTAEAHSRQTDPFDCAGERFQFLAHAEPTAGDDTPFDVTQVGEDGDPNFYQCFYFKAPWDAGALATYFKPVIDNGRVLHHWLLYGTENGEDMQDGSMRGNCAVQGDTNRNLLSGWAPGGEEQIYPSNIGLQLPTGPDAFLTLELHYYNTQPGTPAVDRSGAELCVTHEPREHVAAPHWLGSEQISVEPTAEATSEGMCTPDSGKTATIISISPHMHELGVHAKMEVLRAGGGNEVIFDKPFDFDNQLSYMLDPPIVIEPGDQIRSTCTFRNGTSTKVGYGEGTDDEMCYMFTTAYPAGSLHNGQNGCFPLLSACYPGGDNRCIDGLF